MAFEASLMLIILQGSLVVTEKKSGNMSRLETKRKPAAAEHTFVSTRDCRWQWNVENTLTCRWNGRSAHKSGKQRKTFNFSLSDVGGTAKNQAYLTEPSYFGPWPKSQTVRIIFCVRYLIFIFICTFLNWKETVQTHTHTHTQIYNQQMNATFLERFIQTGHMGQRRMSAYRHFSQLVSQNFIYIAFCMHENSVHIPSSLKKNL